MSLLNDKKNISSSISTLSSISDSLNIENIFDRNNTSNSIFSSNSKDPIAFLLGTLILLVGIEAVKDIISNILIKSLPDIDKQLKVVIKNTLLNNDQNSGMDGDLLSNGVDMPVKDIDYNKKFQGGTGNDLLTPNDNKSMDKKMKDSIESNGSVQSFGNLEMKYDNSSDKMNFKPINNQDSNTFFSNMVDGITFLNKNVIISLVMDALFGVLVASLLKNKADLMTDESFNKMIQNYVDNENIDDSKLFTLTMEELADIDVTINNRLNNTLPLDFGCFDYDSFVDMETLNEILNSDDQINALDGVINNILPQNPSLNNMDDLSPNRLNKTNSQISNNSGFANNTNTKSKVYNDIVSKIVLIIVKNSILSPQFLVLKKLNYRMITGKEDTTSGLELLSSQKNLFKCITKEVKSALSGIIFERVKKELIKKVKPIVQNIATEKLNSYEQILKGLSKIK